MRTLKVIAILLTFVGMSSAYAVGVTPGSDVQLSTGKNQIACPHKLNVDRNAKTAFVANAQGTSQVRGQNATR